MLIVITYDVNTETPEGRKRLRHIAKVCVNYGQRVQNSVFECRFTGGEFTVFRNKLLSLMDQSQDSLRFYHLGNQYQNKIEHFGTKASYDPEGLLMV